MQNVAGKDAAGVNRCRVDSVRASMVLKSRSVAGRRAITFRRLAGCGMPCDALERLARSS